MAKEKVQGNKVRRGGIIAMEIFIILLAFLTIAAPIVLPICRYAFNGETFKLSIFDIAIDGSILNMANIRSPQSDYLTFNSGLMNTLNSSLSPVMGPIFYNVIAACFVLGIIFALMSIVAAIVGLANRKARCSYYFATIGMAIPMFLMYLTPVVYYLIAKLVNLNPAPTVEIGMYRPLLILGVSILLNLIIVIIYRAKAHSQLPSVVKEKQHLQQLQKEYEDRIALEEQEKLANAKKPVDTKTLDGSEYFSSPVVSDKKDEEGFAVEPENDTIIVSPEDVMKNQPKQVVKKVVRVKKPIAKPEPVKTKEVKKPVETPKKEEVKPTETKKVVKKVVVKKVVKKPEEVKVNKVDPDLPKIVEVPKPIFRNDTKELKRLPHKLTDIGEDRFKNHSKIQLGDIPDGITEIGKSAFANCVSLQEVEIPVSVKKILNKAFYKDANLVNIRYEGTREQFKFIERGPGWLAGCGTKLVNCSDGVVSVNPYK